MTPELRRQLKELKPGDHVCPICENTAEQKTIVTAFLVEGLRQGERCLYAAADSALADAVQNLTANGVDVTRELERGALQLLTERESYLRTGEFSPQTMIEFLSQAEAAALKDGFSGFRYLGDMAWVLGAKVGSDLVIEYEALLNNYMANSRSVLLCQYDRSRFDPALIHDVLRTHPIAILGELVCPSPFYEPPQMILGEIPASERVDWKIAQIKLARLAELSRQRDHELLRAVVEGTTDALFVKDPQGHYLMINPAGAQFLGKSVEEVLGKNDEELFTPEGVLAITDHDQRVIATGKLETREHIATAAGVTRTYLTTKGPYRDEFGNIVGTIGIARDITESKRLQAEQDRLTERLRLQIDRMPLAYILLDSSHRVLDWNPAAEKIFGYSKEEALGHACFDLVNQLPLDERLHELLHRIESGDMQAHSVNENRTKDDRAITCEWFNTPLMEADGRFSGAICLAQDITERQRVEEMLDQTRRRFQAIFENALDPIVLLDDSLRFVDANPAACAMYGYRHEELLEMTAWDVTPAEDRVKIPQLFGNLVSAGTLSGDYTVLSKSGETREVEFRAVASILPEIHAVIFRDVTERNRAEQALQGYVERLQILSRRVIEVQEEERRHLARELHDEIGQVLSAISVNLHAALAVSEGAARPRLEDSIHIIDRAIDQLRSLSFDLRPSMLDDLGLVSTLRWYADRQSQRAGLVVHFVAESSAASLPSDLVTACYRVAQEALTNVVRHAQAREVWLEFRGGDAALELIIRDNGIGFDVAAVRQRAAHGASFGVLGMQERVELLGGQIEMESQPSRGTTIHVRLPVTPAQLQEPG